MIINFFLALSLIILTIAIMVTLDTTTSLMATFIKRILRSVHRSKLLTQFILSAYLRYRKTIHKPLINNSN